MSLSLDPFDVWLCHFAFSDKPQVTKVRPAIYIGRGDGFLEVLLVKVTSHEPRDDIEGELVVEDLGCAGLLKKSTIRCSQIIQACENDMIKWIGRLSERDIQSLTKALTEIYAEPE